MLDNVLIEMEEREMFLDQIFNLIEIEFGHELSIPAL